MTDSPTTSKSARNSNLAVAVIAAVAAIAGAAVGGFATYFGNHELQRSESQAAAKGAARVLQGAFASAATRVEVELAKHQYLAIGAQSSITITAEDEKEIAANVSSSTWDHIASAKLAIQGEQESANELSNIEVLSARKHEPVVLRGARLEVEESSYHAIEGAVLALKEIAGTYSGE